MCQAYSGQEGINLFDKEKPNLVVLDILLTDIDGMQVLKVMKQKKPNIPVIFNTAYDFKDDFAIWASDAYLVKKSDQSELINTINRLLFR